MIFACTAVFGLFCFQAPASKTQVEMHRERGVGRYYSSVKISGEGWGANIVNTDRPDSDPSELVISVNPSYAKQMCVDGKCIRYSAFCRDPRKPYFCDFAFEVGPFTSTENFAVSMSIFADTRKAMDAAIHNFAYIQPKTSAKFPFDKLTVTWNPPCPPDICRKKH